MAPDIPYLHLTTTAFPTKIEFFSFCYFVFPAAMTLAFHSTLLSFPRIPEPKLIEKFFQQANKFVCVRPQSRHKEHTHKKNSEKNPKKKTHRRQPKKHILPPANTKQQPKKNVAKLHIPVKM